MENLYYKNSTHKLQLFNKNRYKEGRIDLTRNIWSMNPQKIYWTLPIDILNSPNISQFKMKLKKWILTNIPIGD